MSFEHHLAFLRAIQADQTSLFHWLVYADWLEDQGGDPENAAIMRWFARGEPLNSLGLKLTWVPPGESWLGGGEGKEGEQHFVLERGLWWGVYPVTQSEWQAVMGKNPSWFCATGRGADRVEGLDTRRFPVESVSWEDVQPFLEGLNARESSGGLQYRLPTEAEWEYACRGGPLSKAESVYDFYIVRPVAMPKPYLAVFTPKLANFENRDCPGRTTAVGSYPANRLGVHDMHGNVWEWCADLCAQGGSDRVFRGGSWHHNRRLCRAAYRDGDWPSDRFYELGFRVAAIPSGRK